MSVRVRWRWVLSPNTFLRQLARADIRHTLRHPPGSVITCTPCRERAGLPPIRARGGRPDG